MDRTRPTWLRSGLRRAAVVAAAALAAFAVLGTQAPTVAGFTASVGGSDNSVSTASSFSCTSSVALSRDHLVLAYALDEPTGSTTARDRSGRGNTGTYLGSMTSDSDRAEACPRDPGGAWRLDGSTSSLSTTTRLDAPQEFTLELWARSSRPGGKLIGMEDQQTGDSDSFDRHLYVLSNGNLLFGTYDDGYAFLQTGEYFPDGRWHHVVATMSPTSGAALYVDGVEKARDGGQRHAHEYQGYWRIGSGKLEGWQGVTSTTPTSFAGDMRFAAVHDVALTAREVQDRFAAGS